jgi:hypothetical protein
MNRPLLLGTLCLASTYLILTAPLARAEEELINKNGGFEDGKGFYHIVRPELCDLDTNDPYRGQNAMRLQADGDASEGTEDPMVVAGYNIDPPAENEEYIFRCAVKTVDVDPANPPKISLRTKVDDSGGPLDKELPESDQLVFTTDQDWTAYEVKLNEMPKEAQSIGFWIRVPRQTKSTLYVDEIEIVKVTK